MDDSQESVTLQSTQDLISNIDDVLQSQLRSRTEQTPESSQSSLNINLTQFPDTQTSSSQQNIVLDSQNSEQSPKCDDSFPSSANIEKNCENSSMRQMQIEISSKESDSLNIISVDENSSKNEASLNSINDKSTCESMNMGSDEIVDKPIGQLLLMNNDDMLTTETGSRQFTENDIEIIIEQAEESEVNVMDTHEGFSVDWNKKIELMTCATADFGPDVFLKGCKWSPDGTCLVTNSDDNILRLYNLPEPLYLGKQANLPELSAVLKMSEGELIYDYCWYPLMSSMNPETCCLAATSRNKPVHMWDAYTGTLRASYRSYDNADELVAAHSLAFSLDGEKMFCGFNKTVRIFNVDRPGRECIQRPTFVKQGQPGIISCIAMNPVDTSMYACGSYSRSVALYNEDSGNMICMFQGQTGGVTHIMFSADGNRLYSGGRKDSEILCWDLRQPGNILFTVKRDVLTNQRVYFDLDPTTRYLVSGDQNGQVHVWDTDNIPEPAGEEEPILAPFNTFSAHDDMVNGISIHPSMPYLATASGQRHIQMPEFDSSESETEDKVDNSLRLWWTGG